MSEKLDITIHLSKETQDVLLKVAEAIGRKSYKNKPGPITEGQLKYISTLLSDRNDLKEIILNKLQVEDLAKIPFEKFNDILGYVKKEKGLK